MARTGSAPTTPAVVSPVPCAKRSARVVRAGVATGREEATRRQRGGVRSDSELSSPCPTTQAPSGGVAHGSAADPAVKQRPIAVNPRSCSSAPTARQRLVRNAVAKQRPCRSDPERLLCNAASQTPPAARRRGVVMAG
jgi:hypothetical protein